MISTKVFATHNFSHISLTFTISIYLVHFHQLVLFLEINLISAPKIFSTRT